jgi:MoxR-like ATPase
MTYQSATDEAEIVMREIAKQNSKSTVSRDWVALVVEMVRRTRNHSDLRFGSSVRGAIDTAVVATSLAAIRNTSVETTAIGLDSALVALTGRVRLREGSVRTAEEVITEIFADVFGVKPEDGDAGKVGAPTGATNSHS